MCKQRRVPFTPLIQVRIKLLKHLHQNYDVYQWTCLHLDPLSGFQVNYQNSLKENLLQQLTDMMEEVLYEISLYLHKAYYALYR